MTLVCGIDEAGRGPVIGPMVIVGVLVDDMEEHMLKSMGVKDSKLLLPHKREELFTNIKKVARDFKIIIISNRKIDKTLESASSNLNWLEADAASDIINSFNCDIAYLDCPSNNIPAFASYVKEKMTSKVKIIAEHKADAKYAVVSAASIIAKVIRDKEINKLKKRYNVDFGSGYPSDPFTKSFLAENYDKYPFFRKSWASWKNVVKKKDQLRLGQF